MAARIRSLRNGITPVDEASRNDLVVTDVVSLTSLDAATTYAWSIVFAPNGSTATFSGSSSAVSPGTFTVDLVGPYLIRLVVDASLPTEDTQYVRLRAPTVALGLRLVAAGERRDGTGIIPVDVSTQGWAQDQNFNLQALEAAIGAIAATSVSRETFLASAFTFGGIYSTVTVAHSASAVAALSGYKELFRNGVADQSFVTGAPAAAGEWRVTGTTLQVFGDITASGDTYRVVYPY